jgi:hypothetical protein
MVRIVVALGLIGAWLAQAAVPPHWHAGMSAGELVAHAQRRHVHRSQLPHAHHELTHGEHAHPHHHADHDHGPADEAASDAPAARSTTHDHDAVYLDDGTMAGTSGVVLKVCGLCLATCEAGGVDPRLALAQHLSARPRYGGSVPALLSSTRLLL